MTCASSTNLTSPRKLLPNDNITQITRTHSKNSKVFLIGKVNFQCIGTCGSLRPIFFWRYLRAACCYSGVSCEIVFPPLFGVRLSGETMELCVMIQPSVGRKAAPVGAVQANHRQALFQLLQVKITSGSESKESAFCCLRSLLSFHCCSLDSWLLWTNAFTVLLQFLSRTKRPY